MSKITDFKNLVERIEEMKAKGEVDLSLDEDLALGVMNLIAIEEHLYFTGNKTEKTEYWDELLKVREIRKEFMKKLLPNHEGETWCTSKHLLSASMRLMEVGTKLQSKGENEEAQKCFKKSYEIFNIFWGIKLKLLNLGDLKKMADEEKPWSLNDVMTKLVNCCDE